MGGGLGALRFVLVFKIVTARNDSAADEMSRIVYFPLYLPFSASLPLSLAHCMTAEPYILSCLPLPGWLALVFSPSFYIFLMIYSRIT